MGLPLESFIGPFIPLNLLQNLSCRFFLAPVGLLSVTGAFKLEPVALLIRFLPDSLRPPLADLSEALKDIDTLLTF